MSLHSGGILLFRFRDDELEVLLVHPGGPFWIRKDEGAWSIPKGLFDEGESPLDAAKREFKEETGFEAEGEFMELGEQKQPSRKIVHAWALEKDLDETEVVSNKFTLEWPKKSGVIKEYPEIDRARWFDVDQARIKIQKGQLVFIDRLIEILNRRTEADIKPGKAIEKVRAEDEQVEDRQAKEEQDNDRQKRRSSLIQSHLTNWSGK
jgi:predicted NUDIX family NTP pyrophosphohydrolase